MELIIIGTRRDDDGERPGSELWRVPFRGWDETHRLRAPTWCQPKRYVVVDGGLVCAAGYTEGVVVFAGEIFSLRVGRPAVP